MRGVTVAGRVEAEQHVGETSRDRRLARQDMRAAEVLGADHAAAHLTAQARHVVRSLRVAVVENAAVVRLVLQSEPDVVRLAVLRTQLLERR